MHTYEAFRKWRDLEFGGSSHAGIGVPIDLRQLSCFDTYLEWAEAVHSDAFAVVGNRVVARWKRDRKATVLVGVKGRNTLAFVVRNVEGRIR